MFVKERMMAHVALKELMLRRAHAAVAPETARLIYRVIAEAEADDLFATELDFEVGRLFEGGMADDLTDIVPVFVYVPCGVRKLLERHRIDF